MHLADLNLPVHKPHRLKQSLNRARALVAEVKPDVIHSHFVTTTCLLRLALGRSHPIPRIYQVAGPLHLEHWWTRHFELSLAGPSDVWIGSSRCINQWYRRSGVPEERLFLSYWGLNICNSSGPPSDVLRRAAGARDSDVLVGNVSWMYPPKLLLGQRVGLKCHEDIIEALGQVSRERPDVLGVFVGGAWNNSTWYETKLKKLAARRAGDRIRFLGAMPAEGARQAWRDLDLAVHVPLSENCGGVVEPLDAGVPVIASAVGGLPEVIVHEQTGLLVPPREPRILARTILQALDRREQCKRMAALGKALVDTMFDVERTAREVYEIYKHILDPKHLPPPSFDSVRFLDSCSVTAPTTCS
jgi:glycosyltransferase involved in cell wall biosynthesis